MEVAGKKKSKDSTEPKGKGLFDHLNEIFAGRRAEYFSLLTDTEKKTWSNFMIHRFLSMNPDYVDLVNEVQKYSKMPAEMVYRTYCDLFNQMGVRRAKQFNTYVKSNRDKRYENAVIELIAKYFECSTKEALEYSEILSENQVKELCKNYGGSVKV
jgi:hypothetical protein